MVRMSATEVSRNFSAVMNRVSAGEEIEIVRNGMPIMEMRPPSRPRGISAAALLELHANLAAMDDEFAHDVEEASRTIWPEPNQWPAS